MTDLKNNLEVRFIELRNENSKYSIKVLELEEKLQKTEAQLCGCRDRVASLKKEIDDKIDSYLELNKELQKTREQLDIAEAVLSVQVTDSALAYFKDKQGE